MKRPFAVGDRVMVYGGGEEGADYLASVVVVDTPVWKLYLTEMREEPSCTQNNAVDWCPKSLRRFITRF